MKSAVAFCVALLATNAVVSHAAPCSVETATSEIQIDDLKRQAQAAEASRALLDEMARISEKAKDQKRKLVDQLTPRDASRFAELSQRMASIRLSSHVESGHDRDAAMVESTYVSAWNLYEGSAGTPSSSELVSSALIMAMRQIWPQTVIDHLPEKLDGCNVGVALILEREEAQKVAITNPNFARDNAILQTLLHKYGSLDANRMSPADIRTALRAKAEMKPAFASERLAEDIQNIFYWWQAAVTVYDTSKEDILVYGADYTKIGLTLDSKKENLSERTKKMIQLWNVVNQKVPSEEQKMDAALSSMPVKPEGDPGR